MHPLSSTAQQRPFPCSASSPSCSGTLRRGVASWSEAILKGIASRKFRAAQIAESLKRVESAGFDEVILYFNVGLKPHAQVKEEMARFMEQVAPSFGAVKRAQHVSG
jgi:hypothetical protein